MQIICSSRSFNFIKKHIKNDLINSFILSLEGFNLFSEYVYSYDELKTTISYLKKNNKQVIVDIAKLVHEDELKKLEEIIAKLNLLNVDYFMYSDFGVYYLLKKLGLVSKTMLYSNTYLTNTFDTKIYQEKNALVVLSNQINTSELINISNNSYPNQVISAFGRALIMYTRRPLLTNYFKYRGSSLIPNRNNYALQEEFREDLYPIIENEHSTKIYDYGYYHLEEELKHMNQSANIIVSGELLSNVDYSKVLSFYTNILKGNEKENILDLNIKLNKGAYSRKLTLLKGGASNE